MSEEVASKSETAPADDILKITTWNVASLRASWEHGLAAYIKRAQPDIFCIQETKMHNEVKEPLTSFALEGYHGYFLHAEKKGYAGTAIYTKVKPIAIYPSTGVSDKNGRAITAEFSKFFLVNTYVVNAGPELQNLEYKINTFNKELGDHIEELRKKKPVLWTGDLNVAHKDIDIYSPKGHEKIAGFTPQERKWFDDFLNKGYTDIFRQLHPDLQEFTFFNFRGNARAKNHGWRIDYFVMPTDTISEGLIIDCSIDSKTTFSDHLPVSLLLNKGMILTDDDKEDESNVMEVIGGEKKKTGQATSITDFFGGATKDRPKRKAPAPKGKKK